MLKLYQFPISHYCEKVRWALDFKGLDYRRKNLLPGPHLRTTKKLAPSSGVPILQDGDTVVQGSAEIIDYLEEKFPERPLTPNGAEGEESREWEKYADEELGIHVRRAAYNVLLDHKEVVVPFFAHEGPWYGRPLLNTIFPKLSSLMRQGMNINDETAAVSMERVEAALERISSRLAERQFLVGDSFSRADLAAAALAAPMCSPAGYGLTWPDRLPDEMEEWISANAERLEWVDRFYEEHRQPS